MIIKDFLPSAHLQEFIQCYRLVHFDFTKLSETPVKLYPPKPENCLHFFIEGHIEIDKDDKRLVYKNPVLVGQQTLAFKRYNTKKIINFQIVFQSSAIYRLTGISSKEITNRYIDASCLFSKKVDLINEKLQEAQNIEDMLFIANSFVFELVLGSSVKANKLDELVNNLKRKDGKLSVDRMAKLTNLSNKQFVRKFNESIGINPKTYTRIVRFNRAFNLKNRYPERDWLRISLDCDYYDYQHLVLDYKDFTGFTPTEFHLIESKSPECLLGLASDIYKSRAESMVFA